MGFSAAGIWVKETGHRKTIEAAGIAISMDGRGRFMDNIFIERCGAGSNTKRSI